jgi:dihydrofolate reductase
MKAIFSHCNYIIGDGDNLLIYNYEDLQHFKKETLGKTVICGRKTLETLPTKLRNRQTIVLTSDKGYVHPYADIVCHSREEVLEAVSDKCCDSYVIGGAVVLDTFKKDIQEMVVTEFNTSCLVDRVIYDPIRLPSSIVKRLDKWDIKESVDAGVFSVIRYVP